MKFILPLLTVLAFAPAANAALTLTIDTSAKTVAWSGTFTTTEISTAGFDLATFYLANSLTANPNPSPLKVVAGTNGTLLPVASGFDGPAFNASSPGQVNTTESIGLISVFLADTFDFVADTYTFSVSVADAAGKSYADFNAAEMAFLESLDGETLDLIRRGSNAPTNTVIPIAGGGPAATITVVPEPSSISLLGLGGLALILRRKK